MIRGRASRAAGMTLIGIGIAGSGAFSGARQTPAPPKPVRPAPKGPNQTTIGDVKITGSESISGKFGKNIVFKGSKTIIEVPDKANRTLTRLHADTITAQQEGNNIGQIELTGNVTYHLTKTDKDGGEQVVDGTAGRGLYRRAVKQIKLSEGVRASIQDDARLSSPGRIQTDTLTIDIAKTPFRYTLEGSPGSNDIQLTPREKTDESKPATGKKASRLRVGTIHLSEFGEGVFQAGKSAWVTGSRAQLAMNNPEDKTRAQITAQTIKADFTEEKSAISTAEASGNARYEIERPAPSGKATQTLKGSSDRLVYDAQASTVLLQDGVSADITDAETLLKPAHVVADRVFGQLETKDKPARYQITGSPARSLLRFTPKPVPEKKTPPQAVAADNAQNRAAKPAVSRFPLGDVEVSQFDSSVFEPAKSAEFTGAKTTFTTNDAPSRTRTRFQANRLIAAFADERNVANIEATGDQSADVRFFFERPSQTLGDADPKSKAMESLTGTAKKITFVNTASSRKVTLAGRLQATIRDPENLESPGKISGVEGDTMELDLTVTPYAFSFDSPQGTAKIEFQPKDKSQATANAAPVPATGKPPKSPGKPGVKKQ